MQSSSGTNGFQTLVLLGLIVASSFLVRKGRLDPAAQSLDRRQRIRPLALEWLDPVIAVVLIGSTLWDTVFTNLAHVGVALLGAAIGAPIGVARARVVFVRALSSTKSVVLTRSTAEYLLLGLLLCLRLGGNTIARSHSEAGKYLVGALLGLAVAESVARSVAITFRYRRSESESRSRK